MLDLVVEVATEQPQQLTHRELSPTTETVETRIDLRRRTLLFYESNGGEQGKKGEGEREKEGVKETVKTRIDLRTWK